MKGPTGTMNAAQAQTILTLTMTVEECRRLPVVMRASVTQTSSASRAMHAGAMKRRGNLAECSPCPASYPSRRHRVLPSLLLFLPPPALAAHENLLRKGTAIETVEVIVIVTVTVTETGTAAVTVVETVTVIEMATVSSLVLLFCLHCRRHARPRRCCRHCCLPHSRPDPHPHPLPHRGGCGGGGSRRRRARVADLVVAAARSSGPPWPPSRCPPGSPAAPPPGWQNSGRGWPPRRRRGRVGDECCVGGGSASTPWHHRRCFRCTRRCCCRRCRRRQVDYHRRVAPPHGPCRYHCLGLQHCHRHCPPYHYHYHYQHRRRRGRCPPPSGAPPVALPSRPPRPRPGVPRRGPVASAASAAAFRRRLRSPGAGCGRSERRGGPGSTPAPPCRRCRRRRGTCREPSTSNRGQTPRA